MIEASRVIEEVKEYSTNKQWVDWGKEDPEWVSTNNGVFICLIWCAKHRSLGTDVSKIKSIMHLDWEAYELKALQKGGNKSFQDFMAAYGLNDYPIYKKYNSIAWYYYRKMLQGYIDGINISDLPPVKSIGWKARTDSAEFNYCNDLNDEICSPIRQDNSFIDFSKSSNSWRDRQNEAKMNNSIWLNKSLNVSRYSINIEAQNDLNSITILLNENQKLKGNQSQKRLINSNRFESDVDLQDIDDDMISDRDKYSSNYGTSRRHVNLKDIHDRITLINNSNSENTWEIEGPSSSSNWWWGGFNSSNSTSVGSQSFQILNKAADFSIKLGSFAKQGFGKLMASTPVIHLQSKIREFIGSEDVDEDEVEINRTFANENTAASLPRERRQSFIYKPHKNTKFYE